ncbi:MAG: hypothetical protein KatS3mg108_1171 [Isosphaeraceae bacterium]|jgi:endonuclease-3 related protein|nr:MAG: hypothetical protein KatS3mg108_1171 [Isosphaeraceae bacterium]
MSACDSDDRSLSAEIASWAADDVAPRSLLEIFLFEELAAPKAQSIWAELELAGRTEPQDLVALSPDELAVLTGVAPSAGRGWARRLIALARWWAEAGDTASRSTESLREELRGLRFGGPQLIDAMLLDGLDRAVYPVDRGTYRVLVRHGWIEREAGYDEARSWVEQLGCGNPERLRKLRGGFKTIARRWCRVNSACCRECPIRGWLPQSGPLLDEDG